MIFTLVVGENNVLRLVADTIAGEAKCREDESFDLKTGLAVALLSMGTKNKFKFEMSHKYAVRQINIPDYNMGIVMRHRTKYDREMAARAERRKFRMHFYDANASGFTIYLNAFKNDTAEPSDGTVLFKHAEALIAELRKEEVWQNEIQLSKCGP